MRIQHLAWEFPPLVYGGLGRHVAALSRAQAAAGHEVTVVTQGQPGVRQESGVTVVRVPQEPFPYHLPSLLTWVGELDHKIGRAAAAMEADVVHAHDWVVGRAGTYAARAHGRPLVATIHATEAGRHSGWLPDPVSAAVHLVEHWLVDEADEVIVCSTHMAQEVARGHDRTQRVTVIPNGIDLAHHSRTDDIPALLLKGSPRLTFVGRLEWEKGVFVAVEAMPAIVRQFPQARLRLVGTGSQAAALADLIARLDLTDHVELLGHVDELTLRAAYSSSDLLLAPSSYEPFGIVALEGAALGVPLIVGDAGGLAEFVTDDRGLRITPNDPAALAHAVLQALTDPDATEARARNATDALPEYSWDRIAERTIGVYARATVRPNPPRQLRTDRQVW